MFFDLDKPPWNPHENRCVLYLTRFLTETEGRTATEIFDLVTEYAFQRDIAVPKEWRARLLAAKNKERGKRTIIEIAPEGEGHEFMGQVTKLETRVNFFRRTKMEDNQMGRAMLGRLLKDSYVELQVRGETDESNGVTAQVSVFVRQPEVEVAKVKKGSMVLVTLQVHEIAGKEPFWLGTSLERISPR